MLTGRRLFESAGDLELTSKVLNDEPPRPSAVAPQPLPAELDLIILSCVEKKREDRPQRVTDLVQAFDGVRRDVDVGLDGAGERPVVHVGRQGQPA